MFKLNKKIKTNKNYNFIYNWKLKLNSFNDTSKKEESFKILTFYFKKGLLKLKYPNKKLDINDISNIKDLLLETLIESIHNKNNNNLLDSLLDNDDLLLLNNYINNQNINKTISNIEKLSNNLTSCTNNSCKLYGFKLFEKFNNHITNYDSLNTINKFSLIESLSKTYIQLKKNKNLFQNKNYPKTQVYKLKGVFEELYDLTLENKYTDIHNNIISSSLKSISSFNTYQEQISSFNIIKNYNIQDDITEKLKDFNDIDSFTPKFCEDLLYDTLNYESHYVLLKKAKPELFNKNNSEIDNYMILGKSLLTHFNYDYCQKELNRIGSAIFLSNYKTKSFDEAYYKHKIFNENLNNSPNNNEIDFN